MLVLTGDAVDPIGSLGTTHSSGQRLADAGAGPDGVEVPGRRVTAVPLTRSLRDAGELSDDELAAMEDMLAGQIEASVAAARAAPAEPVEDLTTFVYSPESS